MVGRFSNDLVHGRRLFLANTLTLLPPRAIVLPTQFGSPSHSLARGWVDFCSDPMRLVDGFVVFLAIKEEAMEGGQEGRLRHLLLSKDALGLAPYLCLGRHVVVQNGKFFSWQGGRGGMSRPSWLLVTSASSLLLGEVRSPSPHICVPPSSSLEKDETIAEREVCLHGSVQSLQAGWLTLRLFSSDPNAPSCHVHFSHFQRSSLSVQWYALGAGAEVVFHRLLPIVLHGRLSGYSYTPRSSLSLLSHASKDAETGRVKRALEVMPRFLRHCGLVVSAWRREALQRLLVTLDQAVLPTGLLAALDHFSHKELLSWSEPTERMLRNPLQRVVQEEVVDSWRCALYTVRGGLDGDYLSSLLPRVATVSTVDRLSRSLPFANRKGLCMTVNYDFHYLPASSDIMENHKSLPFDALVGRLVEVRYVSGMVQFVVSGPTSGSLVVLLLLACPSDDSHGFRFVVKDIQLPTTNALLWIRRPDVVVMCGAEGRREVCLLAHPSQVTLFPLEQPLCFIPSAVERMALQVTSCAGNVKGLREVLTTPLGVGGCLNLDCDIMAVVLCRQLHLQDYGETSNSRKRSREPRVVTGWKQGEEEDTQGRVDLFLCDLHFPDTIHFYLSSSESAGLMPGMIISLHRAALCCPQTQRKLYLRTASTSMPTKIAVLGLLDGKGLEVCSSQSRVRQSFFTKIVDRIGLSPHSADVTTSISLPVCNLSLLAGARQWDRRLHRVLLSIGTVRKLQCFLRCHLCFRVAVTSTIAQGNYYCPACETAASIVPVMVVSLLVEDGSAEAMLKVEGSEATAALLQNLRKDPRGLAWAAVREAVEKEVWRMGRFVYDYADNYTGDGSEDDFERILMEGEGALELGEVTHDVCGQTYSALVRGAYLQRPVEAVRSYFRLGLPLTQQFEALVRLENFRTAAALLPPAEGTHSGKKCRTIRLQEVNRRCKHRVQHCLLNTWQSERMELMAVEVKPLRDQQTLAETAYDLLATL